MFLNVGELYVLDGYGNVWVYKFDGEGNYQFFWGEFGGGFGEFRLLYVIVVDWYDRVYVVDCENLWI